MLEGKLVQEPLSCWLPAHTREVGPMMFEVTVPDDWPPGLAMAVAQMVRQSFKDGFPIVVPVRKDATANEIAGAFEIIRGVIKKAGLAAA
jgi:hypothetical protein